MPTPAEDDHARRARARMAEPTREKTIERLDRQHAQDQQRAADEHRRTGRLTDEIARQADRHRIDIEDVEGPSHER